MKNIWFAILFFLLLGGLGWYLIKTNDSDNSIRPEGTTANITEDINSSPSSDSFEGSEKYKSYSSGIIEANNDKRRVLFFFANWCPTCKPANLSFIQESARIPEGVVVIRINYNDSDTDDEEKTLAKKYGVTYQHTYVLLGVDGSVITKWNGGGLDQLLTNLEEI